MKAEMGLPEDFKLDDNKISKPTLAMGVFYAFGLVTMVLMNSHPISTSIWLMIGTSIGMYIAGNVFLSLMKLFMNVKTDFYCESSARSLFWVLVCLTFLVFALSHNIWLSSGAFIVIFITAKQIFLHFSKN
jgi:hypothetical protein